MWMQRPYYHLNLPFSSLTERDSLLLEKAFSGGKDVTTLQSTYLRHSQPRIGEDVVLPVDAFVEVGPMSVFGGERGVVDLQECTLEREDGRGKLLLLKRFHTFPVLKESAFLRRPLQPNLPYNAHIDSFLTLCESNPNILYTTFPYDKQRVLRCFKERHLFSYCLIHTVLLRKVEDRSFKQAYHISNGGWELEVETKGKVYLLPTRCAPPLSIPETHPSTSPPPHPDLVCPITMEVMTQPVLASDGNAYERSAILRWLSEHHTSPLTGERMDPRFLVDCHMLRRRIQDEMGEKTIQAG